MTDYREQHRRRVAALEAAASELILSELGAILDQVAARFGTITAAGEEAEARSSLDDLTAIGAQWRQTVDLALLPWFGQVFDAGATAAEQQVAGLGITVGLADPDLMDHAARQYLAQMQARFYGLGDEAWTAARAELVAGFEAGEGIDRLRARITSVTDLSRARADALARTEVIGASNMGAAARVDLMGDDAPPFKQWLSTLDARTRPTHVAADGQVVPRGERFQVGASRLKVPGDPAGQDQEVMNCRCTVLFLDSAEPLALGGRQAGGIPPAGQLAAAAVALREREGYPPDEPLTLAVPAHLVDQIIPPDDVDVVAAAAGPPQVDSTTGMEHTGSMVALVPADPDAWTLGDGREPADALHLTLGYLGEADLIPVPARDVLEAQLGDLAARTPPLEANVFGASVWNTTGDSPSLNLAVGGDGLQQLHDAVWTTVARAGVAGGPEELWAPPEQHAPWVAHMCVAYADHELGLEPFMADVGAATQLEGPIVFDRLRLTYGGQAIDFPLAGAAPTVPVSDASWKAALDLSVLESQLRAAGNEAGADAARSKWTKILAQEGDTMPWKVQPGGDDCPFEVVKSDSGERVACHDTEQEAQDHVEALYAAEPDAATEDDPTSSPPASGAPPEPMPGEHLRVVMHIPGVATGARDTGRVFTNLEYRETPFAYHWDRTSAAHGGTPEVVHVGNVVRVVPGGADGVPDYGFVTLDLDQPDGYEYARRVVGGFARWVSIGGDETKAEITFVFPDEPTDPDDELAMMPEPDQVIFDGVRVAELTAVSIPAQADATVEPTQELIAAMAPPEPEEDDALVAAARALPRTPPPFQAQRGPVAFPAEAAACDCGGTCGGCHEPTMADMVQAVTAAAYTITIPELPPAAWFREPTDVKLDGAFCVTDEGRIYGLLAPLGTGHRAWAKSGDRLEVPYGNVDYERFMGGWALTADGKVPAGPLTMDCGHAPMFRASKAVAQEHYDNACSVIGHVAVGESRQLGGVWVAGALTVGVQPDQVARALACRCSGDWEPHPDRAGWSELVACLLVPAPGFGSKHPGNRSMTVRDGALVASTTPVHYVPTVEDRQAMARAAAVRRLVDGVGRSPAARVLAATDRG